MSPALLGAICGSMFFLVFLVFHIAVLFLGISRSPSRVLTLTFAGCAAAATIALAASPEWSAFILAEFYALMVMACLFVLYAPFFFTIYTSLSVQSLVIVRRKGGSIPLDFLYRRFASRNLVAKRLATMVASGYLGEEAGSYRLSPKGRRVATFFRALKRLWRLGLGG